MLVALHTRQQWLDILMVAGSQGFGRAHQLAVGAAAASLPASGMASVCHSSGSEMKTASMLPGAHSSRRLAG